MTTTRHGGPLTTERLLEALRVLGTPVVMVDEPTPDDLPQLLGCLAASVDAAVHEQAMEPGAVEQFVEGYSDQLASDPVGAAWAIDSRLRLMALQLRHPTVTSGQDVIAFQSAAEAAMAASSLVSFQLLCQPDASGQRAPQSAIRERLRAGRRFLVDAKRSCDRLIEYLKGRGFQV